MSSPSAEFELLCALARPHPDRERAHGLLARGLDFPTLVSLAIDHGVRPSLVRFLVQAAWAGVPDDIRAELERFQHLHLVRMLALADELGRVARLLTDAGVRCVAFKGATLAVGLYGDLAAREYNDIDLLVPETAVDEAERLIAGLGYRGTQGGSAYRRAFLSPLRQCAYARAGLETTIDLHWGLSGMHLPFPLDPADLLREATQIRIGQTSVPAPTPSHLAALLAGHGTKENWRCLSWVADFAWLVDRHGDLDWLAIHHAAARRGCGNSLLLGCLIAEELLGSRVPAALEGPIANQPTVRARAATLIAGVRQGRPVAAQLPDLADLDLCDRRRDRLRAIVTLAVTPTGGDYRALPLPEPLWGAYRFIRPFRLLLRLVGRIAGSRPA